MICGMAPKRKEGQTAIVKPSDATAPPRKRSIKGLVAEAKMKRASEGDHVKFHERTFRHLKA